MNVPKLRFKEFNDEYKYRNLSDISTLIKDGTHGTHENSENGIPLLSAKDINNNKINIPEDCRKISVDDYNKIYKNYLLKKDDILLTIVGSIGRTALYKNEKVAFQRSVATIRIDDNNNSNYIRQYIESPIIINQLNNMTNSSAQGGVYLSSLSKLNFDIPRKEEQLKVAKFLSLLDEKIELQSKKIEDLKLFTKKLETQYIFNSNNEYNKKRIDEIFNVKAGGDLNKSNISFIKTPLFCYPIYSNNLEMNGLYGYSDIYKIGEESITVTGRGDIGKAIKREGKYYPIVRLLVLIPKISVNLIYMQEAINNLKLIQESTGVPQLTAPQISKYKVSYPTLDIQNEYGDILLLLQEKIKYEIRKTEKLQQLKKGLMQVMFV